MKKICDSDTSSEGSTSQSYKSIDNLHCKKLDFSESEDDSNFSSNMTPTSTTKSSTKNKKVPLKFRSSSSSNDIDFSESENDSLGTRVKKRLAKKAQTNNNLTKITKNKTKIETNVKKAVKNHDAKNRDGKNHDVKNHEVENLDVKNLDVDESNKVEKIKKKNQSSENFGYNERKLSFLKSLSGIFIILFS